MDSLEKIIEEMRNSADFCLINGDPNEHYMAEEMSAFADRIAALQREPVATLHDDGHFVFTKSAPQELKHKATYAGCKMQVYAAPPVPVGMVPARFPTMLRKMWSGTEVQKWLDDNKAMLAAAKEE